MGRTPNGLVDIEATIIDHARQPGGIETATSTDATST